MTRKQREQRRYEPKLGGIARSPLAARQYDAKTDPLYEGCQDEPPATAPIPAATAAATGSWAVSQEDLRWAAQMAAAGLLGHHVRPDKAPRIRERGRWGKAIETFKDDHPNEPLPGRPCRLCAGDAIIPAPARDPRGWCTCWRCQGSGEEPLDRPR